MKSFKLAAELVEPNHGTGATLLFRSLLPNWSDQCFGSAFEKANPEPDDKNTDPGSFFNAFIRPFSSISKYISTNSI